MNAIMNAHFAKILIAMHKVVSDLDDEANPTYASGNVRKLDELIRDLKAELPNEECFK